METEKTTGVKEDIRQKEIVLGSLRQAVLQNLDSSIQTDQFLLNMGPQHPSTHGVLRVLLELDGERIKRSVPDLGYLHRGTEKIAEYRTYNQIIPLTDRLDYVSAMANNYAFVRTVEKLLQLKVPERAEFVRTIVAEIQRIVNHLFWLGTQALDIGAMSVFFYTFREREELLDIFEILCGARLTTNYYRVGGVESDIPQYVIDRLYKFIEAFDGNIQEYNTLLETNRIWLARTKNIAVITAEDAINFGLSGPTLRGSGVPYDLRKFEPYGAYDQVEFDVPVGQNGDIYDRYYIRIEEMRQSAKIIRQCLDKLPSGPVMTDDHKVSFPEKGRVMHNMETLIHHFLLVVHGFNVPPGDTYCGTETPKGELGFYIVSDGTGKPYRMKIRAPSFVNMGAFDHMAKGYMIADIITIFGTYDIVMGECDR